MEHQSLTILVRDSMISMVESSVGSKLFRTLYANVDGEKIDILRGGLESCAYFVSVILHTHKLVVSPHATVRGLVRDMETRGWKTVETPEPGDVIIWEAIKQASDELHTHCGFYMGEDSAISNDYNNGCAPRRHHYTDELPGRAITAIYRNAYVAGSL